MLFLLELKSSRTRKSAAKKYIILSDIYIYIYRKGALKKYRIIYFSSC